MRILGLACLLTLLSSSVVLGETARGFSPLKFEDSSQPGSHWVTDDPTGSAPAPEVDVFSLKPGECSQIAHPDGKTDCSFGSIRSQMREDGMTQPPEVWVAWSMYLPADFPVGKAQAGQGMYTFAYFHNKECPNVALISDTSGGNTLYFQTNRIGNEGNYTCLPDQRVAIGDLRKLRGAWHRFEMYVRFSPGNDGSALVYLDGRQVVSYSGHTVTPVKTKMNRFVYGLYLCCTIGSDKITPAWVLYSDLAKGNSREAVAP